jgi:uncharacterized protein with PQ loop repeat
MREGEDEKRSRMFERRDNKRNAINRNFHSCEKNIHTQRLTIHHIMDESLKTLPYTAISLSVLGRLIFMFLLYKNRSTNSLSLLFCLLNICSSSMWIYYSVQMNDVPMISRSSTEIMLLIVSAVYIIRNKMVDTNKMVLPLLYYTP